MGGFFVLAIKYHYIKKKSKHNDLMIYMWFCRQNLIMTQYHTAVINNNIFNILVIEFSSYKSVIPIFWRILLAFIIRFSDFSINKSSSFLTDFIVSGVLFIRYLAASIVNWASFTACYNFVYFSISSLFRFLSLLTAVLTLFITFSK